MPEAWCVIKKWMFFASVLANLSGAILDESVHPCLVLGFRWNLFFYIPVQYNVEYQHSPSLLHLLGRPSWPGTHYVVQADLQSFCLGLQSTGIIGMPHHSQLGKPLFCCSMILPFMASSGHLFWRVAESYQSPFLHLWKESCSFCSCFVLILC